MLHIKFLLQDLGLASTFKSRFLCVSACTSLYSAWHVWACTWIYASVRTFFVFSLVEQFSWYLVQENSFFPKIIIISSINTGSPFKYIYYLFKRQNEREREYSIHWFTLQMVVMTGAGQTKARSPEPHPILLPANGLGKPAGDGRQCECLALCSHVGELEDVPGSWLQPGLATALAAIWRMNQQMENKFLSDPFCNSAFK